MMDITERLRARYGATFLDEDAAREIERLRRDLDEHKRAVGVYVGALRPFGDAYRLFRRAGCGAKLPADVAGAVCMQDFATAAELTPEDKP